MVVNVIFDEMWYAAKPACISKPNNCHRNKSNVLWYK